MRSMSMTGSQTRFAPAYVSVVHGHVRTRHRPPHQGIHSCNLRLCQARSWENITNPSTLSGSQGYQISWPRDSCSDILAHSMSTRSVPGAQRKFVLCADASTPPWFRLFFR
jgi:hypothetical protein